MPSGYLKSACLMALLAAVGCKPAYEAKFVTSEAVTKLDAKLQDTVHATLTERCGTPSAPKLLSDPKRAADQIATARDLYLKHCQQCHGQSGDGNGVSAKFLYPRPRDYRNGIFKFTSTPYGAKPRREDLIRTLDTGIPGSSMPTFRLLPKRERELLVDYVLLLTYRGDLEGKLAYEAEAEEEISADVVPELVTGILGSWAEAEQNEVHPLTPQPYAFTAENVAAGKAAFLSKGCSKCHGEDGRGQTKDNIGKDIWGFPTKAADLTSGLLHGGKRPIDIYRRIISGINGTPMPGFRTILEKEPETIWNLTAYVLHVTNLRRTGVVPEPGAFNRNTPESGTATLPDATGGAE